MKVEVAEFYGDMHAEDYLDWEANVEYSFFEWKEMSDERKVQFVKLKLRGAALQWWKRVKEQGDRQGKPKIFTWDSIKTKMIKPFLPANYMMDLYLG